MRRVFTVIFWLAVTTFGCQQNPATYQTTLFNYNIKFPITSAELKQKLVNQDTIHGHELRDTSESVIAVWLFDNMGKMGHLDAGNQAYGVLLMPRKYGTKVDSLKTALEAAYHNTFVPFKPTKLAWWEANKGKEVDGIEVMQINKDMQLSIRYSILEKSFSYPLTIGLCYSLSEEEKERFVLSYGRIHKDD